MWWGPDADHLANQTRGFRVSDTSTSTSLLTRNRILMLVLLLVVVVVLLAVLLSGGSEEDTATSYTESTTEVTRQDLVDRETVTGTLQFADEQELVTQSGGTVTAIRSDGSTVVRGGVLWKVNQKPTVLMYGTVPAYRPLAVGNSGTDVKQLNQNLRKLDYQRAPNSNDFTSDTATAVRNWQDDVGLPQTGTVPLGQVVFTPAATRVAAALVERGAVVQPGTKIMSVTSEVREVAIDLDTADQSLVTLRDRVTVTLPDGTEIAGRITKIGTVASSGNALQPGTATEATIPVTVSLDRPGQAKRWDSAPVDVGLQADSASDVLTVPVAALLALTEGGYAVEVVSDSERQLVGVTTGLFAEGQVEITGSGIAEGTVVVVPSR